MRPPAVVKDHLQCIEYDGRHSNPNTIQDNIVYIKAAAKYRLQQLDPQCSHKSGNYRPSPCAALSEQRVEDTKGEKHHDIAQVLRTEVVEEVGNKIILKCESVVVASAGRMVKEKIVDVPNDAGKKSQAQESGDIADEKRRQDDPSGGTPPPPPDLAGCIDYPGNQRNRECLQKEAWVCAEKEILKVHIAWKVHEDASSKV
jgi:hypothetical protein